MICTNHNTRLDINPRPVPVWVSYNALLQREQWEKLGQREQRGRKMRKWTVEGVRWKQISTDLFVVIARPLANGRARRMDQRDVSAVRMREALGLEESKSNRQRVWKIYKNQGTSSNTRMGWTPLDFLRLLRT